MDVGNFVRHLCVLVLRHQVSNYFVNSFCSAVVCLKQIWARNCIKNTEISSANSNMVSEDFNIVCAILIWLRENMNLYIAEFPTTLFLIPVFV